MRKGCLGIEECGLGRRERERERENGKERQIEGGCGRRVLVRMHRRGMSAPAMMLEVTFPAMSMAGSPHRPQKCGSRSSSGQ